MHDATDHERACGPAAEAGSRAAPADLPPLLLLPGLDGTGRLFERLARNLRGRLVVEIVAYPEDPLLGYDELTRFAAERLKALSEMTTPPRHAIVLGESFSGPIAVRLANRHPRRVAGLILAATFLTPPLPAWLMRMGAAISHRRLPGSLVKAMMLGQHRDTELADLIDALSASLSPDLIAARVRAVADVDVRADLATIACPLLVLHGLSDYLVPSRAIVRAGEACSGASIRLLPAPHMLLQTATGPAADEIVAFAMSLAALSRETAP